MSDSSDDRMPVWKRPWRREGADLHRSSSRPQRTPSRNSRCRSRSPERAHPQSHSSRRRYENDDVRTSRYKETGSPRRRQDDDDIDQLTSRFKKARIEHHADKLEYGKQYDRERDERDARRRDEDYDFNTEYKRLEKHAGDKAVWVSGKMERDSRRKKKDYEDGITPRRSSKERDLRALDAIRRS